MAWGASIGRAQGDGSPHTAPARYPVRQSGGTGTGGALWAPPVTNACVTATQFQRMVRLLRRPETLVPAPEPMS